MKPFILKRFISLLVVLSSAQVLYAQESAVPELVICHYSLENKPKIVSSVLLTGAKEGQVQSTFEVTYVDFPEEAKAAFNLAVSIWANTLVSTVPIKVQAIWGTATGKTLASSGATKIFRNFQNVPYYDVWYPVALAESLAGKNLNGSEFDITVNVNSGMSWSYDVLGRNYIDKFDFTTVMLHELAHGLGFASSMKLINNNTQGEWGYKNMPYVYDLYVQNGQNDKLIDKAAFNNASEELLDQFQSADLYFEVGLSAFVGSYPKLFAPKSYQTGGSISHTEEGYYGSGSASALMTPTIFAAEVIHEPGDLNKAILSQMGWGIRNFSSSILLSTEPVELKMMVYPNPADEILKVYMPASFKESNVTLTLRNIQGREIQKSNIISTEEAFSINISHLSAGVYFITLTNDDTQQTRKFIKQ